MTKGHYILAVWGGFLATLTFWLYMDVTQSRAAEWCAASEIGCVRGWIDALSGWAGALVATGALVGLLRQLKIAQDEHASANPPRLAGRQATLYFERIFSGKSSTDDEPFGEVYVFNYGNNDAIVAAQFNATDKPPTFASIVVYVGRHPPMNRPFDDAKLANPLQVENGVLRAGASKWWPIHNVSMVDLPRLEAAWKRRSKDNIYIIGRVHYADTRGVQRHMVFCRVYDRKTRRFLPSGDTEYEYVT